MDPIKIFKIFSIALLALGFGLRIGLADQEAGNRVYVKTSEYGQFYAKSVPSEPYGLKGVTKIYQVSENEDILIQTYDWYAPEIFIEGFAGTQTIYVVQFGPWSRGHEAKQEDLAVAFYKNNLLLKEYSTLDIAGEKDNVSASVSHYVVFAKKIGFRRPWGNQLVFDVERHDGERLSFNTETGETMTTEEEAIGKQFDEITARIGQIKQEWYEKNKATMPDINNHVITEEELRAVSQEKFPSLKGYQYVPGKMWDQVEVKQE